MIYIVWYSTTNASENGVIRAFYDHKAAIKFADRLELKRASEGLGHLIWVDAVEVE